MNEEVTASDPKMKKLLYNSLEKAKGSIENERMLGGDTADFVRGIESVKEALDRFYEDT